MVGTMAMAMCPDTTPQTTNLGKNADAQTFSAKFLEYLEIFDYARLVTHFLGKSIVM